MRTVSFDGEQTVHLLHPKSGYHRARTLCGVGSRKPSTTHHDRDADCQECIAVVDYVRALPRLTDPDRAAYETLPSKVWARMDFELHFRRALAHEVRAYADAAAYIGRSSIFVAERIHALIADFDEMLLAVQQNPDIDPVELRARIDKDERTRSPHLHIGYLTPEREIAPPEPRDNWADRATIYAAHDKGSVVHGMLTVLVHTDPSPILDGKVASAETYCGIDFNGVAVYGTSPSEINCPTCMPAARADWETRYGTAGV